MCVSGTKPDARGHVKVRGHGNRIDFCRPTGYDVRDRPDELRQVTAEIRVPSMAVGTSSTPLTAAAMARLIDIAWNAADSGFGSDKAVQGWWAVTPASSLGDPQQWTDSSVRRRSSRARYSTWTPAPP